ncbi:MAG: hypothetical protein M1834_008490, partial [Cirrosporium novae-zelandiae]
MNSSLNTNDNHNVTIEGWVPQTDGRGTLDIIWSCTITIFLCCWTSVCANIPATTDSPWNWFRDKLGLACMGILWPDFLFGLALGQWDSARRSVEKFHSAGYLEWTMSHAFFADMGGFIIQFSDCISFPVDAEQLHYLISKGYLEYPKLDKAMIDDKNKADNLSR